MAPPDGRADRRDQCGVLRLKSMPADHAHTVSITNTEAGNAYKEFPRPSTLIFKVMNSLPANQQQVIYEVCCNLPPADDDTKFCANNEIPRGFRTAILNSFKERRPGGFKLSDYNWYFYPAWALVEDSYWFN